MDNEQFQADRGTNEECISYFNLNGQRKNCPSNMKLSRQYTMLKNVQNTTAKTQFPTFPLNHKHYASENLASLAQFLECCCALMTSIVLRVSWWGLWQQKKELLGNMGQEPGVNRISSWFYVCSKKSGCWYHLPFSKRYIAPCKHSCMFSIRMLSFIFNLRALRHKSDLQCNALWMCVHVYFQNLYPLHTLWNHADKNAYTHVLYCQTVLLFVYASLTGLPEI